MARRISLTNEMWSMSGHRSLGDFLRGRAEFSEVGVDLPSSVEGALERAGLIPDYRLDERGCEWAANRLWVVTAVFDMPPEPEGASSEKHFLCIEEIFGEGAIFLNGSEILSFGPMTESITADVTGEMIEEGENRLQIAFSRCGSKTIEGVQAAYEGLDAPFTAPRGIRGDVYIKSTSYCRIEELRAGRFGGKVFADVKIDAANRGKYMFKYRIAREGQLVGTVNIIESLLAVRQELRHEIDIDSVGDCAVRLTIERGGVRCDFETAPVKGDELPVQKLPEKIRAVAWSPISPRTCDVSMDEYERAFALLKNMGANAVYLGRGLRESALFEKICRKAGMALIRESQEDMPFKDAATIRISTEKDLQNALQNARRSGKPLLIMGMISPLERENPSALFTWDLKPTDAYGHVSQSLRPWMVCIEKGQGEGGAGTKMRIVSCCDDFSGQVVLAEVAFWDYVGALITTRAASFVQDCASVHCGEIFPPRKEGKQGLMAIDVKLYTKDGLVASCREIYDQRTQREDSPMPRVQKLEGVISIVNDSPHYSREMMVIDGRLKAHMLALRPWEKIEVTA